MPARSPKDSDGPRNRYPFLSSANDSMPSTFCWKLRLHVDQHVPTQDQLHAGERRMLDHVVRSKDHPITKLGDDLVSLLGFSKKARNSVRGNILDDGVLVLSVGGPLEAAPIDVGGEHLNLQISLSGLDRLGQQNGDRIGLLASGATGHPNPHRVAIRALTK